MEINSEDVLKIENNEVVSCDKSAVNVVLPEDITRVRRQAFLECDKLESITINAACKSIGELAFSLCTALKSVELPEGLEQIGAQAFKNCTSLSSVKIPDGCKVKSRAFERCKALESVVIPNIENDLIAGYREIFDTSYIKHITIADGVEKLPTRAFEGFYSLETLELGKDVAYIDDFAFCGLWREIKIELRTPHFAFENGMLYNKKTKKLIRCFSKNIVVPSFIKSIGGDAFFAAENPHQPYIESVSFEAGCAVKSFPKAWKDIDFEETKDKEREQKQKTIKKIVDSVKEQCEKQKLKAEKKGEVSKMGAKSVLEAIVAESGIILEKWEDKENQYIGVKCNRGGIELKLPNKSAEKWHTPLKELLGMVKSKDVLEIVAFAKKNKLTLQSENAQRYAVVDEFKQFCNLSENVFSIVLTKGLVEKNDYFDISQDVFDEAKVLNEVVIDGDEGAASVMFISLWLDAPNLKSVKYNGGEMKRPEYCYYGKTLYAYYNKDVEGFAMNEGVERINSRRAYEDYEYCEGLIYCEGVFENCFNLKSVKLPQSLTEIDDRTFFGCHNLSNLAFAGTVAQWRAVEKGEDWHKWCNIAVVHCSDGDAELA